MKSKIKYSKVSPESFDAPKKLNHVADEYGQWTQYDSGLIDWHNKNFKHWLSVKKAKDCLFSRRNGYKGKIVFGYSIRLRLFGKEII